MRITKHQCIANFLIGFGSILNLSPLFAEVKIGSPQDDLENLRKDWEAVGSDMYNAMEVLNNGTNKISRD